MENTLKTALLILVVLYVISPVDLVPGPIDDIIVSLLYIAASAGKKRLSEVKSEA